MCSSLHVTLQGKDKLCAAIYAFGLPVKKRKTLGLLEESQELYEPVLLLFKTMRIPLHDESFSSSHFHHIYYYY